MRKQIWKFVLNRADRQTIKMPHGAHVISVQMQKTGPYELHGTPCLWAIVEPNEEKEDREFLFIGTGHDFDEEDASVYIGTIQDGPLVWHVFESL